MTRTLLALLLLALSPAVAQTQVLDGRLSGLAFGDNIEAARAALAPACRSISSVELDAPRFPLAAERESHLVCSDYTSEGGLKLDALDLR
ncbi:MAG: hypothetical protein HKM89_05620, partial [Gemmatimonadales bacterium]|nr:hypothetical protein [Gemmatimonadales bacterium]